MPPPRTFDPADVAELLSESIGVAYGFTVEITHPLLAAPLRFTQDVQTTTANGNDFEPLDFSIELATQEEARVGPARLVLGAFAVSAQVVAAVRQAVNPPALVVIRLVDFEDADVPKLELPPLQWRGVRVNPTQIEGTLVATANPYEEPYPGVLVTPFSVPGVFGVMERP